MQPINHGNDGRCSSWYAMVSIMAIHWNNCLVNVVRKRAKFKFSCLWNHYMMQVLPFLNVLAAGALTPLRLIRKLHVILEFPLWQSLLSVNDEQQTCLLEFPEIIVTMRVTSAHHRAHIDTTQWRCIAFTLFVDTARMERRQSFISNGSY